MSALAYHRMPGFGYLSGPRDPQNAPLGDYEAIREHLAGEVWNAVQEGR